MSILDKDFINVQPITARHLAGYGYSIRLSGHTKTIASKSYTATISSMPVMDKYHGAGRVDFGGPVVDAVITIVLSSNDSVNWQTVLHVKSRESLFTEIDTLKNRLINPDYNTLINNEMDLNMYVEKIVRECGAVNMREYYDYDVELPNDWSI